MEVFETGTIDAATNVLRALKTKCKFRQKILDCLDGRELTVTEIMERTKFEQSVASQHLRILRDEGIVKYDKNGKFHVYSINKRRIEEIEDACKTLSRQYSTVDQGVDFHKNVFKGQEKKPAFDMLEKKQKDKKLPFGDL